MKCPEIKTTEARRNNRGLELVKKKKRGTEDIEIFETALE
jgi:hypothetical protein